MTETSPPAGDGERRSLDDLLDGQRFAMLTTGSAQGFSSRPLTLLEIDGATLRFIVSRDVDWVTSIGSGSTPVHVSFSEPKDNLYVSLTATATVTDDRQLVQRLWTPAASAFLTGPEDASAVVLEAEVTAGEWWDGPSSSIGQAVALVSAIVSGDDDRAGDHGTVSP